LQNMRCYAKHPVDTIGQIEDLTISIEEVDYD
jgi:hypothetical protein